MEISRRAAREHAYVFASIGPAGRLLATGDPSEAELREVFTKQVESLTEAGPDALVIETLSDPGEANCAVWAAHASGLPVVAGMAFDSGKNKTRTMMGTAPQEAALILTAAVVIGANCGQGIEGHFGLYKGLVAGTECPIWLKPNAGSPELVGTETVYRTTPEAFAESASALVNAGVAFIGGCCGTTPAFIATPSRALHPKTQAIPCA